MDDRIGTGKHQVPFDSDRDLVLHRRRSLPAHPNGMVFRALDGDGALLAERTYYSVGGGFVVDEAATGADRVVLDDTPLPFPFTTGAQLLAQWVERFAEVLRMMHAQRPVGEG